MSVRHVQLPIHPKQHLQESVGGYLLRLAKLNHASGLSQLLRILGLTFDAAIRLDAADLYKRLSGKAQQSVTGQEPANALDGTGWGWTMFRTARYCSCCLSRDGYWHRDWAMPLVWTCLEHRTRLVSHCCACSQELSFRSINYDACKCGHMLRQANMIPAPAWIDSFHQIFTPWRLDNPNADNDALTIEREIQSANLVTSLIHFGRGGRGSSKRKRHSRPAMSKISEMEIQLSDWCLDWPESLKQDIGSAMNQSTEAQRRQLRVQISQPHAAHVWCELEPIFSAFDERVTLTRRGWKSRSPVEGLIGLTLFARSLGINSKTATDLFDRGVFQQACCSKMANGRIVRWVSVSEVDLFKGFIRRTLSRAEAAEYLRVKPAHIHTLVTSRYIKGLSYLRPGRSYRLRVDDLDALVAKMHANSKTCPQNDSRLIPLNECFADGSESKEAGQTLYKWGRLMDLIRNKRVSVFCIQEAPRTLDAFAVSANEIAANFKNQGNHQKRRLA